MVTFHNFKTTLQDIVMHSPQNSRKLLPQKTYDNFTRIPFTIFKNFSFSISLVNTGKIALWLIRGKLKSFPFI